MDKFNLNSEYETILSQIKVLEYDEIISKLFDTLPVLWTRSYNNFSPRISNICVVSHDSFHYIFDIGPIDEDDFANSPIYYEPRIVTAYGISKPQKCKRDDERLRGWVGKTEEVFGKLWDKGHFIAHSIGGAVDRNELNIFPQKRTLNRGLVSPR